MVNYTDMRPGTLLDLVLVSVQRHCRGMCKQETVSSYVWLRRGVPSGAVHAKRIGAAPWWQLAAVEAAYSFDVGLIDGDPVLHPVPKALETGVSVRGVIVSASQHIQLIEKHLKILDLQFTSGFAGVRL